MAGSGVVSQHWEAGQDNRRVPDNRHAVHVAQITMRHAGPYFL